MCQDSIHDTPSKNLLYFQSDILRIRTIFIRTNLAIQYIEIYQYQVYNRYQSQQQPPSAFNDIMQTTYTNSNTWQKECQINEPTNHWYPSQQDTYQKVEQTKKQQSEQQAK